MILKTLTVLQVILIVTSVGYVSSKIEANCWGPGIWPYPHYCHLFSLCILDLSQTQNLVSGQLFLCPEGMGFSSKHKGCIPSSMAESCSYNAKDVENLVESSSAEHLLSPEETNQFHCAGHSSPYCDGSDILVVCGPNQTFLGAVNCSHTNSGDFGVRKCDKEIEKCATFPLPEVELPRKMKPELDIKHQTELNELSATCKRPGKQCTSRNHTLMIDCSDNLQVVQIFDCSSILPSILIEDASNVKAVCDPKQDSCVIHIGNIPGENLSDEIFKISQQFRDVKEKDTFRNSKVNIQEKATLACQHSGRQCASEKSTIILDCSDDLKVIQMWDCASLFPVETMLDKTINFFECNPKSKSCVMNVGLDSGNPMINISSNILNQTNALSFNSPQEHSRQEKFSCSNPGFQCTAANKSLLLECSDALEVLNVHQCTDLFSFETFDYKYVRNASCDPQRDKCVLFLDEQQAQIDDNKQLYGRRIGGSEIIQYECKEEGMHCSINNTSIALECSENLKLLHIWDCRSLIPSKLLENDTTHVVCDHVYDSCILYFESNSEQQDIKRITKQISEPDMMCIKPGKQCTTFNTTILIECSEDLEVLQTWDCASLFPHTFSKENHEVQCSPEEDSCILFYPDTTTVSLISVSSYTKNSVSSSNEAGFRDYVHSEEVDEDDSDSFEDTLAEPCRKEGLQCADNKTIINCPPDLIEPTFVMSCSDVMQVTNNEKAYGYCDDEISSCMLKINKETFKLGLSLFDIREHAVFPSFTSKCKKGGLHCADNVTLVLCSGQEENADYAVTCGYSNEKIKAFCDTQTESCFVEMVTATSDSVSQITASKYDNNQDMIYTVRILEMTSIPGMLISMLKQLSTPSRSSVFTLTPAVYRPTTPNPTIREQFEVIIPQLKSQLPTNILNESKVCSSPGWSCFDEDILIFCSDKESLEGFLPCSEAYREYQGEGYCDKSISRCVRRNPISDSGPICTKPGLQCLNDSTIGVCSFELRLEYSFPCAVVHTDSSCHKQLNACISSSMHIIYNPK